MWHAEIWGKYTQVYLRSMKRLDNVGILTTDVKYLDLFKRVWCNDMEWIHLAQESAECSKWRTQGCTKSRGSAIGIANMLRAGRYRVLFLAGVEKLLFSKRARPVSASHPVSCSVNTRGTLSGGKASGVYGWSVTSNSKDKNEWSYTSTSPISSFTLRNVVSPLLPSLCSGVPRVSLLVFPSTPQTPYG